MGFNIGSVLSSLNIPSLNLGSIGSDILTEGKKLLGDVVKDSFTLSNQPGGQTFASTMNLDVGGTNLSLPNPIGALANKLLSGADTELNKFGVNVDFKQVASELFNLPTQTGGTVTVPSAASRAASLPSSPTAAVASNYADVTSSPLGLGGGGAGTSGTTVGGTTTTTSSPGVINATGISSTSYNVASGGDDSSSVINGVMAPAETLYNKANSDLAAAGTDPGKLQAAAAEMQQANEAFSMISDMLKDAHDTRMTMINNMAQ